jgi:hypothetical protein
MAALSGHVTARRICPLPGKPDSQPSGSDFRFIQDPPTASLANDVEQ